MHRQIIPVPTSLAEAHPFVASTREAALGWICITDGRLSPRTEPGIAEVRVSRAQLDRALRIVQAVIMASEARGMDVSAVGRTRSHRAGVGIGRNGCFTAVRVEERRRLVAFSDLDLEQWRLEAPEWFTHRELELRERGWCPRANGKLRVLLPRRYDRSPDPGFGWRSSFADQDGRSLETKLIDVVIALDERARADNELARLGH